MKIEEIEKKIVENRSWSLEKNSKYTDWQNKYLDLHKNSIERLEETAIRNGDQVKKLVTQISVLFLSAWLVLLNTNKVGNLNYMIVSSVMLISVLILLVLFLYVNYRLSLFSIANLHKIRPYVFFINDPSEDSNNLAIESSILSVKLEKYMKRIFYFEIFCLFIFIVTVIVSFALMTIVLIPKT